MLLRNDSRIKHSIQIRLVFDDNRRRLLEIHEFDKVQISYRKNGRIKFGYGIIKKIKPYVYTKKWFSKKESAIIEIDMSSENNSKVECIDMYDIIDIRKRHILPRPDDRPEPPEVDIKFKNNIFSVI